VIITGAPVMGDADAGVTLIEYSDYGCPYCARHSRQTMPEIIEHYINKGKVKFVIREFPIPNLQPRAMAASMAALCAGGQGKYWEMHRALISNQRKLSDVDLRGYASQIGLDTGEFDQCLEREDYAEQIEKDIEEGNEIGIRGTPSFMLGLTDPSDPDRIKATKFIYGARNYEFFAQEIDELLASLTELSN
jgi:protein-disulfide isomerase